MDSRTTWSRSAIVESPGLIRQTLSAAGTMVRHEPQSRTWQETPGKESAVEEKADREEKPQTPSNGKQPRGTTVRAERAAVSRTGHGQSIVSNASRSTGPTMKQNESRTDQDTIQQMVRQQEARFRPSGSDTIQQRVSQQEAKAMASIYESDTGLCSMSKQNVGAEDLKRGSFVFESAEKCQAMCKVTSGCRVWNYNFQNRMCQLKKGVGHLLNSTHGIAGGRECKIPFRPHAFQSKCSSKSLIPAQYIETQMSLVNCYRQCKAQSGCKFFSWVPNLQSCNMYRDCSLMENYATDTQHVGAMTMQLDDCSSFAGYYSSSSKMTCSIVQDGCAIMSMDCSHSDVSSAPSFGSSALSSIGSVSDEVVSLGIDGSATIFADFQQLQRLRHDGVLAWSMDSNSLAFIEAPTAIQGTSSGMGDVQWSGLGETITWERQPCDDFSGTYTNQWNKIQVQITMGKPSHGSFPSLEDADITGSPCNVSAVMVKSSMPHDWKGWTSKVGVASGRKLKMFGINGYLQGDLKQIWWQNGNIWTRTKSITH